MLEDGEKSGYFLSFHEPFFWFLGVKKAEVDRNNPNYVFVMIGIHARSVLVHDLENVKFLHFFHRFSQQKLRFSLK